MDWPTGCASAPLASNTRRPKDGKRLKETDWLEIVMVKRVLPPDTTACIFWLRSRRKVEWRE
jgi:hypothetical protein